MIEFVFTLSILGNAWQWVINERQSETIETIKQVNKSNAITVNNFKTSLTECSNKLSSWHNQEQAWQQEREQKAVELGELQAIVDSSDWGDCRSPVNLEF